MQTIFYGTAAANDMQITGLDDVVVHSYEGNDHVLLNYVDRFEVYAGEGDDDVLGGGSIDEGLVYGGNGNDSIYFDEIIKSTFYGEDGNDVMSVSDGIISRMYGGLGNDEMAVYRIKDAYLSGGDGNDDFGAWDVRHFYADGGAGDDSFAVRYSNFAKPNDCVLDGGAGDDGFILYRSNDATIYGDEGSDFFSIVESTGKIFAYGGADSDSFEFYGPEQPSFSTVYDLRGGAGDDTFYGEWWFDQEVSGDVLITGGAGADTVDLQNVIAEVDVRGGTGNDDLSLINGGFAILYGEGGNDVLNVQGVGAGAADGGNGNDLLLGDNAMFYGGAGDDRLDCLRGVTIAFGDSGTDTFVLHGADAGAWWSAADIGDFNAAGERIELEGFGNIGPVGSILNSAFFYAGSGGQAQDANDRILFDTDTGALYYDADGNGSGAAVHLVTIYTEAGVVDNTDFLVV